MDKLANDQWMERVLQEDVVGWNEFYPAKLVYIYIINDILFLAAGLTE